MIKHVLSVLCCVILFTPGIVAQESQEEGAFVINGQISNAEGKSFTLVNADNNKKVAKAKVRDGTFQMTGSVGNTPTIFALQSEGNPLPVLLIGEIGDTIKLNGKFKDLPVAEVSGNRQSVDMQQYQKEFTPYMRKAQDINQRASAMMDERDTAAISALQKEARQLTSQMQSSAIEFLQYHPNSLASVFVLMNEMRSIPPDKLKDLYASLSDEVQQSKYGKMTEAAITSALVTAIGAEAPDFTLKDVNNEAVSLSSFRGKYVLIDFWASWCGPCRVENPNVVEAYNHYKKENFTILGVSLDRDKDKWTDAIREDHLTWTQVSDLKGWNSEAADIYNIHSIPANFLIGPSGKIIAKDLRGEALTSKLDEIFQD